MRDIPGIDVKQGITTVADDEELYKIVLETYVDEGEEKEEQLLLALNTDLKMFKMLIHGYKSASNSIGAFALGEKARLLEEAAKSDDIDYLDENTEEFMTELHAVIKGIKEYLGS